MMLTIPAARPPLALLPLLLLALLAPLGLPLRPPVMPAPGPAPAAPPGLAALPLTIVPGGAPDAPYRAFGAGASLAFAPAGPRLALDGVEVDVTFDGARPEVALVPADRRAARLNLALGARAESRPTYGALIYRGLYPGVDLRYDALPGQIKGTYTVAPQADPAAIRWRYAGAAGLTIDHASGDLLIDLPGGGRLTERAPVAWQEVGGRRAPVAARFVSDGSQVGFALGAYDPALPLVIDPTIELGSYLGGGSADFGRGVTVDRQGAIYLVGDYLSSDFLGEETATAGSRDVIVVKLSPAGDEVAYISLIGGADADDGLAITVSAAGEAYVLAGPGADFFTHNAPIAAPPELGNGVLFKLNPAGGFVYSTYVGLRFSGTITGDAIALGPDGALYLTGETYDALAGKRELGLLKVDPASGAVRARFAVPAEIAGWHGAALAIGPDGALYLTGTSYSVAGESFPATPGALQTTCGRKLARGPEADCDADAFVLVLNPNLTLRAATYLGGDGAEEGRGIAVDRQGNIIVAGTTFSADFPLKSALQPACPQTAPLEGCSYDSFVAKLNPDLSGLIYSSYITSADDVTRTFATDVAVDAAGNAFVYGFSNAEDLPTKGAVQPGLQRGVCLGGLDRFCFDAFLIGLTPAGGLHFGSYLGGTFDEYSGGLAIDGAGRLVVVGYTDSSNFPLSAGSVGGPKRAGSDIYVARLRLEASAPNPGPSPGPYRLYLPLAIR